jgi:3-hydroxy-3-methylglutaryl CoA synthase
MSGQIGIVAYGAYVPQLRLRRSAIVAANLWVNPSLKSQGKGERAFASWDEDVVTMAVEAARDALGGISRASVSGLILASTTAPFADRLNAGIVSGALGLSHNVTALDLGGSMRAGTSALIAGAALAAAGDGPVIVAAAERMRSKPGSTQEFGNADAGAAIVLGRENIVARIVATHSVTRDFVDHFRSTGEAHDYGWEERWVREEGYMKIIPEAVSGVLKKAQLSASDVNHFILPSSLARIEAAVAKKLGIADDAVAPSLKDQLGFAGSAQSLLMLAAALQTAKPGQRILLAGFGNGCDAILLETTNAIIDFAPRRGVSGWLAQGKSVDDYMRFLSYNNEVDFEWGARAEFGNKYALTTEFRGSHDMLAFIGGRDKQTGVVQFPKTPMAVAPGASGAAVYEDVPLAEDSARVVSCTADWLTYHPSPPFYFGLVQFENGARVAMEFVDVKTGSVEVGATVNMLFRVKEIDRMRNYRHYFWKATPAGAAGA